MRLALIANPGSGGGTDPDALAERLRAHGATVSVHTPRTIDDVAATAPERVVVASGDGSVALAAALAGRLGVPLGLIPSGTANDFARGAGIPLDAEAACALVASTTARERPLDLGRMSSGRPFVNVVSAGLASVAARQASAVKRHLGPLAYPVGAVTAALSERPIAATVLADRAPVFSGGAWQVIVAVTGRFGGGAKIGRLNPHDGELDVAVVTAGPRLDLVRHALGMRQGRLVEQRGVVHAVGCEIELHLAPGTALNVDGEVVRAAEPERITIEHGAFRLLVPA